MELILDTNALSAFADGEQKLLPVIESTDGFAVPAIVLGEYLFGIRQSRYRARYASWLETNLAIFELLPVGSKTAHHYSAVRHELKAVGKPIPTNDLWIAALAREYRIPILTRDSHFGAVNGIQTRSW